MTDIEKAPVVALREGGGEGWGWELGIRADTN